MLTMHAQPVGTKRPWLLALCQVEAVPHIHKSLSKATTMLQCQTHAHRTASARIRHVDKGQRPTTV